jgi:Ca2+-binding EF-hand superfamily protein
MSDHHAGTFAALGSLISKTLSSKRGLIVPGLGLFTYTALPVSLEGTTNPRTREKDTRSLVFIVSSEFHPKVRPGIAHATGVRPYSSVGHGSVPTVRLSYAELGLALVTSKDEAKARLDKALLSLLQRLKNGLDIRQEIPSVGTLVVRSGISAVIFSNKIQFVPEATIVSPEAADWLKTNLEIDVYNLANTPVKPKSLRPKAVPTKLRQTLSENKAQLELLCRQIDAGESGLLSWQDLWSCVQQLSRPELTEQAVLDWVNCAKAMTNFKVRYQELLSDLEGPRRPASSMASLVSQRTSMYDSGSLKQLAQTIWEAKLALVSAASQPPNKPRVRVACSELLQLVKKASVRTNVHQLKALVQEGKLDPLSVSMLDLIKAAQGVLRDDGRDLSVFNISQASSMHGSPTQDSRKNFETYLKQIDLSELCEACKDHRGFIQAEVFAREVSQNSNGKVRYHEALEGFKRIAEGSSELTCQAFLSKMGVSWPSKADMKSRVKAWLQADSPQELFERIAKGQTLVDLDQFKAAFQGSGLSDAETEQLFQSILGTGEGTIDQAQFTEFMLTEPKRLAAPGYFTRPTQDLPSLSAAPAKPAPLEDSKSFQPRRASTPDLPRSKTSGQLRAVKASSNRADSPLRRLYTLIKTSPHDIKHIFAEIDTDANGKISAHELRSAIRRLKLSLTSKEIDEVLTKLDTNKDGQIDFDEFCTKFRVGSKGQQTDSTLARRIGQYAKLMTTVMGSPKEAFKQFDLSRSDRLDFDSFASMLSRLSKVGNLKALTQTDLRSLFTLVDTKQDGVIDMREWLRSFKVVSSDLWEDSKQHEELSKHLARNSRLLAQMFEEKSVQGHVLLRTAKELLAPVLESYRLKEDHWRRLLAVAEENGSIDYRLFLDIYRDRAAQAALR